MTAIIAAAAFGLTGLASGARAEGTTADEAPVSQLRMQPRAVVELFTSQGCSSCPSADALLGKLAGRNDVVALSMSVDYWDYLGWKDTLSNPLFTERQRAYSKSFGEGGVYTPQAVINGAAHINGSDEAKINQAIDKAAKSSANGTVPIRLNMDKGKLVVEAGAPGRAVHAKEATLWLALITKTAEVPITRGENRGRTLTYYNVVRDLRPIGTWNGTAMTVQLERQAIMVPGTDSAAVLLQQGKAGPIVGAALLRQF
jgi:hypothetical protein